MIFEPIVCTIRHPPKSVPSPIAVCAESTTHSGTSALAGRMPFAISSARMIPIVFWASFAPWREAERGGREELAHPEPPVQLVEPPMPVEHPVDQHHEREAEQQPHHRRQHDEDRDLLEAARDQGPPPRARHRRAGHRADDRVRGARGKTEPPRDDVPGDRADETGEDHGVREHGRFHDICRDRGGDRGPEDQERREVEERGPRHRLLRREHARRDDGRDRVRRVVEAVEEVERQARSR